MPWEKTLRAFCIGSPGQGRHAPPAGDEDGAEPRLDGLAIMIPEGSRDWPEQQVKLAFVKGDEANQRFDGTSPEPLTNKSLRPWANGWKEKASFHPSKKKKIVLPKFEAPAL